jgi:hypothetical protein
MINIGFAMKFFLYLAISLISTHAMLVAAENLKVPIGTQTPESQQIARPTTGTTKAQVKNQYGEPLKENPAKGKPPISNWEYAEFTVYFENDHVIHSVVKPKLHESKEIIIETTDEMSEDDLKLKALPKK